MAIVSSAKAGLAAAPRATILQLRGAGLSAREIEQEAMRLVASSPIPVVISSRCDLVLATQAAGVNLPERDIAAREARALLGQRLVGRSVHSLEAARQAEEEGADYLVFGPVWKSPTHPDAPAVGVHALSEVAGTLKIPVLAIGGVTEECIADCHAAGAAGYAAITLFR
ncbi:MAG TPA: thiamine phosphate synthase [Candidatus Dormibacteraeota bacterium]|nr:thiamine phosphate synthase [Candidatus Dormibacteraeota bacterium]